MVPIDECEPNIPCIRWRVTRKNDDSPCGALTKVSVPQSGNKNKREMALVWRTSSLLHTNTLLIQPHNMTTVKEILEQCR